MHMQNQPVCSKLHLLREAEVLDRDLVAQNLITLPLEVIFHPREITCTKQNFQCRLFDFLLCRSAIPSNGLNALRVEYWLTVVPIFVLESYVSFLCKQYAGVIDLSSAPKPLELLSRI